MKGTIVYRQAEAFKSGWVRAFYGCHGDHWTSHPEQAENPAGADRDRWIVDFWRGFLAGKATAAGPEPVRPFAGTADDSVGADVGLTMQVIRQFAGGASIKQIADGLKMADARVEVRVRGAVSAVLRFLAERPGIFSTPPNTPFEAQLSSVAHHFRRNGEADAEAA
jgi:hypothetical protein